ncbi:glycosyltransferase [Salegentibacter salarius]|uniref:Uncharacterized protein n=1 Tax=Salegentibacter salarius TaxID=435906 RepID=A0A2N0U578_9FLAO|nr:glycosyltransferase [Salegentibacter salarius]OEY73949.1 hypothetical protein BHS39_00550 [Salegentibacter salarius]PKD22149.1 hypothetical protein APR40_00550 [Salegentibacter salarius]SLJ86322.1 Spore coat polysaccharide biosynthesis protein SpsG, predicted glycosyltransferase [Salegentibacter salarius]
MKFLFRVDAGGKIGLGHFFRSINLAKKLTKRGHSVIFVHKESLFWKEQKNNNFPFEAFQILTSQTELEIIKKYKIDKFFVDGIINFSTEFVEEIKLHSEIIFYQNLSDSKFFADKFILPSIHQSDSFFNNFNKSTKIYQGLQYFTFNENIEKLTEKKPVEKVKNIGVIAGGSDPKNTLEKILSMLEHFDSEYVNFIFFYGVDSSFDKIFRHSKLKNSNISCLPYDHSKILNCDLLISAFGVSTYEFMVLGMPIIAYGHQLSNSIAANYLASNTKGLVSLGFIEDVSQEYLFQELRKLIQNKESRDQLVNNAKLSIDLFGIERVIKIIENE